MSAAPPFLTRVCIRNYRSIAACDVNLGSLAFLVGPNGSGKSNFLDAIRFVADALDTTLDHALRDRGGIEEVRRRPRGDRGRRNHFAILFGLKMPNGLSVHYSFEIGTRQGRVSIIGEECSVTEAPESGSASQPKDPSAHGMFRLVNGGWFRTRNAKLNTSLKDSMPAVAHDRLYLVSLSGIEPFRSIYDALTRMRFYSLSPEAIRTPQPPDPGMLLRRDGGNLASVIANLQKNSPDTMDRITQYLSHIVPGVQSAERKALGPYETIEFLQKVEGREHPWRFPAASMSDGTLRALGILVALLQDYASHPSLVAIEEPELGLHPAAANLLLGALHTAKEHTQVLVTSHSSDLLHSDELPASALLAVEAESGATVIGAIDEGSRQTLHDRLFTPGELLRLNMLDLDDAVREVDGRRLSFFSHP